MNRHFDSLRPVLRAVVRRAGWVLAGAVLISVLGFYFGSGLRIDTDFANLVPDDYPSVQALERLRETVGGESEVAVGIVSPSFDANKKFAKDLIPEALQLTGEGYDEPYLTRAEFQRDVEYLRDNALYFASDEELRRVQEFLDEQVNEARQEANPFYVDIEEDEEGDDQKAQELEAMYDRLVGSEYQVSEDSTTLVVDFYPAGSQTNVGYIDDLYRDLDALVDSLEPSSYHPEMEVTLAGRLLRQEAEVQAITSDVVGSFGTGVAAVLLVVMLYFLYKSYRARAGHTLRGRVLFAELARAPVLALVIAIPLFMSLTWTAGMAYLAIGSLNIMTSTLGLVLFGLGIDFGIHFYARYTEERAEGAPIADAAETTFVSTGQAIATGALTTAAALYVLIPADFKGFSEFGFIAGTGVLFALVAMTVVMPALLAVFERTGLLNLASHGALPPNGATGRERFSGARPIVVGSIVAVVAALVLLPRLEFEYDFGVLEPDYEVYEEREDVISRAESNRGGNRRNPAYVVVDSAEEVPKVVRAVREKMQDSSSTILAVESLQERFPLSDTARQNKLEEIAQIREQLNSKYLRDQTSDELERLRRAAQVTEPIDIEQVPEFLRKQFTTKSGEVGKFVMIYPSVGLSDGRNSIAFSEEIGTITTEDGETYHAGSTSLVAADMLKLLQAEAPWMIAATFLIVMLLMYVNFQNVRWAGLALIPLVVGVLWMILAMVVFGLKLNFYNLVVLPAILGIGNDAGVHMVHRYREEGYQSIWTVLRSTGEHVTMGTLTTMIGFGGLLLSFHPGLNSMGTLAVVGLCTTLLAAVVFLPALLQWMEDGDRMPDDLAEPSSDESAPPAAVPEVQHHS